MNILKYLTRQFNRFKIDILTQRKFLAGQIASIDNDHIIKTVSTNYEELEIMFFEHLTIKPDDVIIDVGCGKGRVFSYLLYKGLKNKMIGYEINPVVGEETKKRLAKYKNIEITCINIFDEFPKEGNIFYLYNPFKEDMMSQFITDILKVTDRDPVIIYNNPIHLSLFDNGKFTYEYIDKPIPAYDYNFQFAIIKIKKD
ncbi:class I SAM-dependent methyltransferase [Mucilaginibacter sp.]|uniref:class I SAM-dependent methyltransferase n=1 Tax=Mucilaginibacter sp. TaxID=1882438 RepID=UPI0035BBC782